MEQSQYRPVLLIKGSMLTCSVFLHETDKLKYAESYPRVLCNLGKNATWNITVLYTSIISTERKTQCRERNSHLEC